MGKLDRRVSGATGARNPCLPRRAGDWNAQNDQLLYYEGTVWYRRKFDCPTTPGLARQFIYFGGANYEADVYLNGKKLGRHIGGFGPFQFEVTGRLSFFWPRSMAQVPAHAHAGAPLFPVGFGLRYADRPLTDAICEVNTQAYSLIRYFDRRPARQEPPEKPRP